MNKVRIITKVERTLCNNLNGLLRVGIFNGMKLCAESMPRSPQLKKWMIRYLFSAQH